MIHQNQLRGMISQNQMTHKKVFGIVAVMAAILGLLVFMFWGASEVNGPAQNIDIAGDMIRIEYPQPGDVIKSPLTVRGEARGGWYFEADFPITLTDWDGRIIAQSYATAEGEWMTTEFVPFEGKIEFENPASGQDFTKNGYLIFHKDNPSGLPEHDAAVEILIRFE